MPMISDSGVARAREVDPPLAPQPPPLLSDNVLIKMLMRFPTEGDLTPRPPQTPPAANATCRRRPPPLLSLSSPITGLRAANLLPASPFPALFPFIFRCSPLSSSTSCSCLSFPQGGRANEPTSSCQIAEFLLAARPQQDTNKCFRV